MLMICLHDMWAAQRRFIHGSTIFSETLENHWRGLDGGPGSWIFAFPDSFLVVYCILLVRFFFIHVLFKAFSGNMLEHTPPL